MLAGASLRIMSGQARGWTRNESSPEQVSGAGAQDVHRSHLSPTFLGARPTSCFDGRLARSNEVVQLLVKYLLEMYL
jgi:hypothetical protein